LSRSAAGDARDPEGDGSMCERPGVRRPDARRWSFHVPVRLCIADIERRSIRRMREYDAEDAVRFYALHMRAAGFIKSTPQKIIADSTDWRFLDELKRELKA